MIKTTSHEEKVTKVETIIDSQQLICDYCGEDIPKRDLYFKVTQGHNDWGSDSHESITCHDACQKCLDKTITEFSKETSNTKYIEIKQVHH